MSSGAHLAPRVGRPAEVLVLTRAERRVLEHWARGAGASAALAARAAIVLACAGGATRAEVASRFETSAHRVGRWCRRFAATRLEGLLDGARPGALVVAGDHRERALASLVEGRTSTRALATACGISQPTASRLRRELSLDPSSASRLPPALWGLDLPRGRIAGLFVSAGHCVLVVGASPAPALRLESTTLDLHAPRDAARRARKQASLKLRRFLRAALRAHPGRLHAIAHATPGPAVRNLLEKSRRLAWHPLATRSSFDRLVESWLLVDGGRVLGDPAFARARDDRGSLTWLAPSLLELAAERL